MKSSTNDLIRPAKPAVPLPPTPQINHALIEICRHDFMSFAMLCMAELNPGSSLLHNFHLEALAFRLDQVVKGKCKALMVNMPPRYGKSIFTSVAFPAYVLGLDPTRRIIIISHSLDLAVKLSNDFRRIINSQQYRQIFPGTRISRVKNTEQEVVTTRGGFRLAASIEASVTGRGGHFVIFDDPISAADVYSDTKRQRINNLVRSSFTRLDDKETGAVIIAMQRLHADDPCGLLLSEPNDWTHLNLPAIAENDETIQVAENRFHERRAGEALHPDREPISILKNIESQVGSAVFAAHYQQRPEPRDGLIFKRDWIRRYDQVIRTSSSIVYQSWDTAIKNGEQNDYAACVTLLVEDKKFFVLEVVRERLDYPDLLKLAKSQAVKHQPTHVLIEDCGLGTPLRRELERAGFPAIGIKPQRDKVTRMKVQSVKFEQGLVYLPRQGSWLFDFEVELFSVPNARHDDQVDALCQGLDHAGSGSSLPLEPFGKNYSKLVDGLVYGVIFRRF